MTRWVRSGTTQKHKKMPGDATKWGEFDHQKRSKSSPKKQKKIKTEPNLKRNKKSLCVTSAFPNEENIDSTENHEQFSKKQETVSIDANESKERKKLENCITDDDNFHEAHSDECSTSLKQDAEFSDKMHRFEEYDKQKGISIKKNKKIPNIRKYVQSDLKNSYVDDKRTEPPSSAKVFENKREMYLKKLQKKRADKGIMLLPSNVERKLYNIKRKLREKGLPPQLVKEVIRKERRKAELKFRKTFNPSKRCFHCRQSGHLLADCPKKLGSSSQETGICFKCGSVEHTSFKCTENVQGFPFAKCFICKEQGHISKDCSRNKHGVYPKGGKCNLCGNVNHLKKDCPSLNKKKTDESTFTLHTLKEETSIDAEVIDKKDMKTKSVKKTKIVVF